MNRYLPDQVIAIVFGSLFSLTTKELVCIKETDVKQGLLVQLITAIRGALKRMKGTSGEGKSGGGKEEDKKEEGASEGGKGGVGKEEEKKEEGEKVEDIDLDEDSSEKSINDEGET